MTMSKAAVGKTGDLASRLSLVDSSVLTTVCRQEPKRFR